MRTERGAGRASFTSLRPRGSQNRPDRFGLLSYLGARPLRWKGRGGGLG